MRKTLEVNYLWLAALHTFLTLDAFVYAQISLTLFATEGGRAGIHPPPKIKMAYNDFIYLYLDQFGVFRFQFFLGGVPQNSPRKNLKILKLKKMGPLTS